MQVTIKSIERIGGTNSRGEYTRTVITTDQYGGRKMSSFDENLIDLNEGDTLDLTIIQDEKFLNFHKGNGQDTQGNDVMAKLNAISATVLDILSYIKAHRVMISTDDKTYPYPTTAQQVAMDKNNHIAGGLGLKGVDDTGAPIEDSIPF